MKYIIIGLGNFGGSLAEKLTAHGDEVIGIDRSMAKVDAYKEKISHTICLDSTDEFTVTGLPLHDTDIIIVAIGEDQGANVMTTALFKNLGVKRLISRAINPLHEKVLKAIGVDEIVHPEEETAERWAKKLCFENVVNSYELNSDYSIIEANVKEELIGKTIQEAGFRNNYNLLVLTTIKKVEVKSRIGKVTIQNQVDGVVSYDYKLAEGDILVLFGANKDLRRFLNS